MTTQLVDFIKKASDAYYNGEPIIDDETFDAAVAKLAKLDPKNPFFNKVGKDKSSEFEKRNHLMAMTSQQKASNPEELKKWFDKGYCKNTIIVNHKLDGLSVELQYKSGKFRYGVTRGDGKTGDDITQNVLKMKGIVTKIPDFTGSVRGEIVMSNKTFNKKYKPKGHKMPRTMASGLTKRPDGVGCEDLKIIVYDVVNQESPISTETEKMEFLNEYFPYTAETRTCKGIKGVLKWYNELIAGKRDNLDVAIDGLVIKCDEVDLKDMERVKPNKQIALKFPPRQVTTTLLKVVWNISGTSYTPVAHIEPVNIDGSTVTKASLCNPGIMKNLGLRIGSTVTVTKRGDINPKIESVIELGDGDDIEIPKVCENCSEILVCTETKLYCPNQDCDNKLLHQIQKWISTHDIKEFGKELIGVIYKEELVKSLSDLYTLEVDDLKDLTGSGGKRIGEKNAQKALANLHAKKEMSLQKFIAGFDISGIGEKNIEILIQAGFDTLSKIRKSDLSGVKGFGDTRIDILTNGLAKWKKEMDKMASIVKIVVEEAPTSDVSVCFTGKLSMPRKEAEALVKAKGGTCKGTVTKGLTYLVTSDPDSGSAKNEKAKASGVKVISEEEFQKIFS